MDFDPTPFNLTAGLKNWLLAVAVLAGIALIIGLRQAFASAGSQGSTVFVRGFLSYFRELFSISARRILALAGLTLKECLRRKALLVFVVFAVLLMFAGWFLTDSNNRADLQINVHIRFMLTTISWLILPVVMFLSCWGIPEDIRVRSLHTVVTKPVRRVEIVVGRMLGFSVLAGVVLLLMGAVGYLWIQRQVPESAKSRLTCRVPIYSDVFFFLDREGQPKSSGLNVGDPWLYRSFVEGNSKQRAIWLFEDVTPDVIGDELKIESRFEAFRTIKGDYESMEGGLEAQFTLVNNMRENAFALLGAGVTFRPMADALRAGKFQTAAEELRGISDRLITGADEFPVVDLQRIAITAPQAAKQLEDLGADYQDVTDTFRNLGSAAAVSAASQTRDFQEAADACAQLAELLDERGPQLLEAMPRLEVPLEPFRVAEYHEGDDWQMYPRKLTYAADYEGTARFLAKTIDQLNESGKVVEGSELSSGLIDTLSEEAGVAPLNAELVFDVLNDELEAGTLEAADNHLATADESRWLTFFDRLVNEERLISQDPAGWQLTADLFEDLAPNGKLRVEVACLNDQMYLGMARADMFIRLPDNWFVVGFGKSLLNIGLMLALVIAIGVTASCVVKGPVAFFFTLTVFIVGQFFHSLMQGIVQGTIEGGGMLESAVLIVQHRNPNSGMDASEGTQQLIQTLDGGSNFFLTMVNGIIPNFNVFSSAAAYIENGFDVPWDSSVLPAIVTFFGFVIPCILIGSACLKFRELEAK